MTTRTPKHKCEGCGNELDAMTSVPHKHNVNPQSGDVAVCFYCGNILIIDQDLNCKVAIEDQLLKMDQEILFALRKAQIEILKRVKSN